MGAVGGEPERREELSGTARALPGAQIVR